MVTQGYFIKNPSDPDEEDQALMYDSLKSVTISNVAIESGICVA